MGYFYDLRKSAAYIYEKAKKNLGAIAGTAAGLPLIVAGSRKNDIGEIVIGCLVLSSLAVLDEVDFKDILKKYKQKDFLKL